MPKNNVVDTETYTCSQIRYKVLAKLQPIEKMMDMLLENNNPCNVKKMVIQPRTRLVKDYASYHSGIIENDDMPWIKNESWTEHNRID